MSEREMREMLQQTLDDYRLTRGERKAVAATLREWQPSAGELIRYRQIAFELAKQQADGLHADAILEWLDDVTRLLVDRSAAQEIRTDVFFSPCETAPARIAGMFHSAREQVDICVFTITDDRISSAILDAHRRGVRIRVLTDDEKTLDQGSDVHRLERAGIEVRHDGSPYHMHHKFAIFDRQRVLTGSYNWTRNAGDVNRENVLVTDDARAVSSYIDEFESLWREFQ